MSEEQINGPGQEDRDFVAKETGGEGEQEAQEAGETGPVFVETEAMLAIRQQMEAGGNGHEKFRELTIEWYKMSDEVINALPQPQFEYAKIEAMRAMANVYKKVGSVEDYYDEMECALDQARAIGAEEIVESILAEWHAP